MNRMTDEQLIELEELHRQMTKLDSNFYNLDRQFHRLIYSSSRLPLIFMTSGWARSQRTTSARPKTFPGT